MKTPINVTYDIVDVVEILKKVEQLLSTPDIIDILEKENIMDKLKGEDHVYTSESLLSMLTAMCVRINEIQTDISCIKNTVNSIKDAIVSMPKTTPLPHIPHLF